MSSYSKFNIGDLVKRKSKSHRTFWQDKVGIVVAVIYKHGDPRFTVKWNHIAEVRNYTTASGLERI